MTNEEIQEKFEQLASAIDWIKTKLVDLQEEKGLAPVKTPYEVEVPTDIEDYYSIGIYGIVDHLEDFSAPFRENCYIRGLAFKTREQAEQHDKELILLFKLHKWAEEHNRGWTPDWEGNGAKWYVTYETDRNILKINWCVCCRQFIKLPYFKSEELAREFIDKFGDEIIEVLC
ncbi:hypothetical protein [Gemella haemolysans]|uniref:hypothetical protein n=1 Tax=Gemella haemolysans TaxID=1379 RepID=UPI0023797F57|nr:hypothetical protein [Gemella haemolysans]